MEVSMSIIKHSKKTLPNTNKRKQKNTTKHKAQQKKTLTNTNRT